MMRTRLTFLTDIAVPCLIMALLWIPRPEHVASTADAATGAVLCVLAVAATALSRRFPVVMPVVLLVTTIAGWALELIRDPFIALVVEPETVRTYLKRIFAKTGMTNRTMLAVAAIEAGLAAPGR
ncbi:response regulator transcription factor [Corynebacterium genitalium ATCC 33030]|uniref:Uncharacterized protein n=1 Tax=Corynebacterium genitalium ATCC 33030 TaxID=585529 RepID=D7WBS5_9CORY|nr:response regulator transcription factor [Corynebacterium genitalium]EFK55306.1 hypothetical protein HMPREF0291_10564 [Corynebacterium genitalium ATCC 33030]UUA89443.1 response regulator transcription factor [Corynebacterium genitalium ATCC 33030]